MSRSTPSHSDHKAPEGSTDPPEAGFPAREGRRNVIALGLVSMFNDVASEMVYPIIPVFLTTVLGAPVAIVGLIEGIAEATANTLKVFSGWLSDRLQNRKRFAAAGYALSALAKVILSFAASWTYVLTARFMDRFGKGVRTSARDALIADSAEPATRATAFGLHRALDTAGAVAGPLLALLLLSGLQLRYASLFLLAAIPAFIGVGILLIAVKEPPHDVHPHTLALEFNPKRFGRPFTLFLIASLIFGLGNSSDAFLILRAQSLGASATETILLYVVFNASYSLLSYPLGRLADRFGSRRILVLSFFLFALVYAGFGAAGVRPTLWILFPLYGIYMAMSEGIGKAYITTLVPANVRAMALGLFTTLTGIITFFSSIIAGLLWDSVGIPVPFYFGATMAVIAGGVFMREERIEAGR